MILAHTEVIKFDDLSGLSLRLVTKYSKWWRMTPEDLRPLGVIDPYWAFAWPGGVSLAKYILGNPWVVHQKRVVDLGTGSGITSLAALKAGALHVTMNDIDEWALQAAKLNLKLNPTLPYRHVHYSSTNLIGTDLAADVLLLGDVTYSPDLVTALLPWISNLKKKGVTILLADPGRGHLPKLGNVVGVEKVPSETDDGESHLVEVGIIQL